MAHCLVLVAADMDPMDHSNMDHSHHHSHPMATPTSGGHDHGGDGGNGGGHEGHMGMVSGGFFSAACSLNMIIVLKAWSCCLGDDLLLWLPKRGAAVQRAAHQLTWRSVCPDWFHVLLFIFDPHALLFSSNQRWSRRVSASSCWPSCMKA